MTANGTKQHYFLTMAELEALYEEPPYPPALVKEIDHVNSTYRALIEASPFFALATNGPDGLDCSPRGDPAGFVRVLDEKTVIVPDRRGNNRIDSLRNLIHDPRVALLFLIPGVSETLRIASESHDLDRSGAVRKLRRSRARRRAPCWWSRSSACSSNAPRRSCAQSCGTRHTKVERSSLPNAW